MSGTGSNAVAYADPKHLTWIQGEKHITKFSFEDGWSSTFCNKCGSPLPQTHPDQPLCFVPAGVLDDDPGPEVMGHIYVGSMASWDYIGDSAPQYDENIS